MLLASWLQVLSLFLFDLLSVARCIYAKGTLDIQVIRSDKIFEEMETPRPSVNWVSVGDIELMNGVTIVWIHRN